MCMSSANKYSNREFIPVPIWVFNKYLRPTYSKYFQFGVIEADFANLISMVFDLLINRMTVNVIE